MTPSYTILEIQAPQDPTKDLYLSDDPNRPDPRQHNYWPMLQALAAQGKITPGELTRASIYHDDDCAVFEDGYCNCEPDIVLKKVEIPPEGQQT